MGALALLKSSLLEPETALKLETSSSNCALIKRAENLPEARNLTADQAGKRDERWLFCSLVVAAKRDSGKSMQDCCIAVATKDSHLFPTLIKSGQGGKSQLTYNNCRHWLRLLGKKGKDYDWSNRDALVDNYRGATKELAGDPNFWPLFRAFYLSRQQLSVTESRRLAIRKCRADNPFAVIPSFDQVKYQVKKFDATMVALARMGEEHVKNHHLSYINRDWSDIRINEIWIADHRVFDMLIKVIDPETGKWKAVRPWLCAFMDSKSWYMASWQITAQNPNNETIRNGLALGISQHGRPGNVYTDNGKDFLAKGFSDPVVFDDVEHSILGSLGINVIKALPYNGRAKTVERGFKNHATRFDKMFAAYVGNKPGARPDSAHYFYKHPEQLPTLEEFTTLFQAWLEVLHGEVNNGKIVGGKTPKDAFYNGKQLERAPMNDVELFAAFLMPQPQLRKVGRGPAVSINNTMYYGDCLYPYFGQKIMIKVDRFDLEHVYVFESNGKPIGECLTRKAVKALALTPEDRKAIGEGLKQQRSEMKRCYTMLNEATNGLHLLSPIELLALPKDFDIVKLGSTRSVKGANHTFSNYKALPKGAKLIDIEQAETSKFDFKEDRKEERLAAFGEAAVEKNEANEVSDPEKLREFFKVAVQKQTGDDDYEY
jgi:Mu transposase-like protein